MGIQVGQTRLVLASASPRRREFLERLQLTFQIIPADVDEAVFPGELPHEYVLRIARAKAARVAGRQRDCLVLAADTSVVLGREILGKPTDVEDAKRILRLLSGNEHLVMTAVALDGTYRESALVETRVRFRKLADQEIDWYVRTGEPLDKAGAYGIQGLGGAFVRTIDGSASNVVGLPLVETLELLQAAGHPLPWRTS